jgi:hypothetical protein
MLTTSSISWFDSVDMAEDRRRAYFWLRPTQYTPFALGLIDLSSSAQNAG